MGLYTFFMDFKGGTYASQINADSYTKALERWAKTKLSDYAKLLNFDLENELIEDVSKGDISALQELKNVWCVTFLMNDSLALVNFTQTVE